MQNLNNCTQFVGDDPLSCKNHGYKHTNDLKFKASEFRSYIKKEYEFKNSPFVYKKRDTNDGTFKLKPHQKFIGKYINGHTNNNGILMYASVGSGKSLSSIVAGICHIAYYSGQPIPKITVIAPANLIENYKNELSGIGPEQVLVDGIKHTYRGGNLITAATTPYFIGNKQNNFITTKLIKKHWQIFTHQSFVNGLYGSRSKLPGKNIDMLKEPGRMYIIDEVHNLVSESGEQYNALLTAITNYMHSTSKLILMSATPIVDSVHEIGLTLNLLRPRIPFPTTKKAFDKLTSRELKYMMYGYVSYFAGGDPRLYPEKTIKMVYHRFIENSLQYENYIKVYKRELPKKYVMTRSEIGNSSSGFFVNSLIASNIFFNSEVRNVMRNYTGLDRFRFAEVNVSVKYANVCKRVSETSGTAVVFSQYIDMGVKALAIILESLGFRRYDQTGQLRKNKSPKYIIWSGAIKDKEIFAKEILSVFNSDENIDGKHLKVILATRAISEGITFKNVRNLHICSNFWNENVTKQVIGRCDRMNSHSALPRAQRKLNVYRHIMVLPSFGKMSLSERSSNGLNLLTDVTIEEYVEMIAKNKSAEHNRIQKLIQSASVDCKMNRYGNKNRTYIFKDNNGTYIRDNVTDDDIGVIVDGVKKCIGPDKERTKCIVSDLLPSSIKSLASLKLQSRNAHLGQKLLSSIMHSKMTNEDVVAVEKIKRKLIKCAVASFGPGGVPRAKQPSTVRILRHIKDFMKIRKIKKNATMLYKQLIGTHDIISDSTFLLIEDLKEYIHTKIV